MFYHRHKLTSHHRFCASSPPRTVSFSFMTAPPQTAFAGTLALFLPCRRPAGVPASAFPPVKAAVDGHWVTGRQLATLVATRGAGGGVALQARKERGEERLKECLCPPPPSPFPPPFPLFTIVIAAGGDGNGSNLRLHLWQLRVDFLVDHIGRHADLEARV